MAYKAKKKTGLPTKIFVWFMFGVMLFSFIAALLSYIFLTK